MLTAAALSERLDCSAEAAGPLVKRTALQRKLTQAEERVSLGCDRIAYQREIVLEKDEEGLDGAIALAIHGQLEILQRIHIAERDRLLAETGHGNNRREVPNGGGSGMTTTEHTSHRDFDQRLALRRKYSRPSTGMNSN